MNLRMYVHHFPTCFTATSRPTLGSKQLPHFCPLCLLYVPCFSIVWRKWKPLGVVLTANIWEKFQAIYPTKLSFSVHLQPNSNEILDHAQTRVQGNVDVEEPMCKILNLKNWQKHYEMLAKTGIFNIRLNDNA